MEGLEKPSGKKITVLANAPVILTELDVLSLARWQFGLTTIYHFLFVPLTIGLVLMVAGMQTAWYRTGKEKYLKQTKFFGKIFLRVAIEISLNSWYYSHVFSGSF